MSRPARAVLLALLVAAGAAGCGGAEPAALAPGCADPASLRAALTGAPRDVALPGGTTLSGCLQAGTDDAELQAVGLALNDVAAERRTAAAGGDVAAATQLGFLVGATRRGARGTNGVLAELERRILLVGGRSVDEAAPAAQDAFRRGMAAGSARG